MEKKPAVVLRAAEIEGKRRAYTQRLNPNSLFDGAGLASVAGLSRVGVSVAWLPPGKDSFAYHAHRYEEEWMYILSGKAIAEIDGQEMEVGPGDFLAFPAPQVPHLLKNRSPETVMYLMGGERNGMPDVIDYPQLGKRYVLLRGDRGAEFYELGDPTQPFGRVER
jgi:uncharacterized cupin superfamily protein